VDDWHPRTRRRESIMPGGLIITVEGDEVSVPVNALRPIGWTDPRLTNDRIVFTASTYSMERVYGRYYSRDLEEWNMDQRSILLHYEGDSPDRKRHHALPDVPLRSRKRKSPKTLADIFERLGFIWADEE